MTRSSCYTELVALKNVTITLDEETARWARIRAAERNTSVSKLVGEMLHEEMEKERTKGVSEYEKAMLDFFALPRHALRRPGERFPTREEVHDRHLR